MEYVFHPRGEIGDQSTSTPPSLKSLPDGALPCVIMVAAGPVKEHNGR